MLSRTGRLHVAIQRNFRDHFAYATLNGPVQGLLARHTCWQQQRDPRVIDHDLRSPPGDLERAARFYEAVLAPLGLARFVTRPATIGFCAKVYSEFLINLRAGMGAVDGAKVYIALRARSTAVMLMLSHAAAPRHWRAAVTASPGIRPHDRVKYYAAFVVDPDGNRIEAVTRFRSRGPLSQLRHSGRAKARA